MGKPFSDTTTLALSLPTDPALLETVGDLVAALSPRDVLDLALNSLRAVERRGQSLSFARQNGGGVIAAHLALSRLVSDMVSAVEAPPAPVRRAAPRAR